MAVAAQRHVHIFTSDHLVAVFAGGAEGEARILLAELADSGQFLDFLALGDERQDGRKSAAQERALER